MKATCCIMSGNAGTSTMFRNLDGIMLVGDCVRVCTISEQPLVCRCLTADLAAATLAHHFYVFITWPGVGTILSPRGQPKLRSLIIVGDCVFLVCFEEQRGTAGDEYEQEGTEARQTDRPPVQNDALSV